MCKFILKLRKRAHLERDLDEEFGFHRKMSDRQFGDVTRIREEARDLWTSSIQGTAADRWHADVERWPE